MARDGNAKVRRARLAMCGDASTDSAKFRERVKAQDMHLRPYALVRKSGLPSYLGVARHLSSWQPVGWRFNAWSYAGRRARTGASVAASLVLFASLMTPALAQTTPPAANTTGGPAAGAQPPANTTAGAQSPANAATANAPLGPTAPVPQIN